MILEDNETKLLDHRTELSHDEYYDPSPELQKQIQKLIEAEKLQRTRTWSYWEKLRRTDPVLYRSAKMSEQRFQDATALGDDFKDGNYND